MSPKEQFHSSDQDGGSPRKRFSQRDQEAEMCLIEQHPLLGSISATASRFEATIRGRIGNPRRLDQFYNLSQMLGPNRAFSQYTWITQEPDLIFPYATAHHSTGADTFYRLIDHDNLMPGGYVDAHQSRLGARMTVRKALYSLVKESSDTPTQVWLTAEDKEHHADVIRANREAVRPPSWKSAKQECLDFVNGIDIFLEEGDTVDSRRRLEELVHLATRQLFFFVTAPVAKFAEMPKDSVHEFSRELRRKLNSLPDTPISPYSRLLPEDLGIVNLQINMRSTVDRIMELTGGYYPLAPSDRNNLLIASAPNINIKDVDGVEVDQQFMEFIRSNHEIATYLRQRIEEEEIVVSPFRENTRDLKTPTPIDIRDPSCAFLYKDPSVAQANWRAIAQNGLIAPVRYVNFRNPEWAKHWAGVFGYEESDIPQVTLNGVIWRNEHYRHMGLARHYDRGAYENRY